MQICSLVFLISGLCFCPQLVNAESTADANVAAPWQALRDVADKLSKQSKSQEAKMKYEEAYSKMPASASASDKAYLLYSIGLLSSSNPEYAAGKLREAISLYEQDDSKQYELLCALEQLGWLLSQDKKQSESAKCYAQALIPSKKKYGNHLQHASVLLLYANASSKACDLAASQKAIDEALSIIEHEDSLDEKRLYLTELLDGIGLYFEFNRHDNVRAEQMFKQAILEGESLWYPLYGWSTQAMSHYESLLQSTGRKKEAEEISRRLISIGRSGKDPKGKDVCKFWNGKTAPAGAPGMAVPIGKGSRATLTTKSPQTIYKSYLNKNGN